MLDDFVEGTNAVRVIEEFAEALDLSGDDAEYIVEPSCEVIYVVQ